MVLSKRIMPFKERSKEFDRLSTKFVDGGFLLTAGWIRRLSKDFLLPKVTLGEVLEDWKDADQVEREED